MSYLVKFPTRSLSKKFTKTLDSISPAKLRHQIKDKVLALGNDPRPHGEPKIKPPAEVYSYVARYRLRVGNYRVLYDVDDKSRTVWIFALRKRNERTY